MEESERRERNREYHRQWEHEHREQRKAYRIKTARLAALREIMAENGRKWPV